ncbi:uncharacterized protein LOC130361053 [Hyla sarda]|uniref:uncharacterized protein LOC130361053 n=1 Tax=Hyla sarda TaxID=327740 RepID=UPI0024C3F6D9|nr:uncharacterized protein LOC130361053 [Hyla sarda]
MDMYCLCNVPVRRLHGNDISTGQALKGEEDMTVKMPELDRLTLNGSLNFQEDDFDQLSIVTETVATFSEWNSDNSFEDLEEEDEAPQIETVARRQQLVENTAFQNYLLLLQQPIDQENRLDPYSFQNDPQWGPGEERPRPLPDPKGRLQDLSWCKCRKCNLMTSVVESICCTEYAQVNSFCEEYECATLHPDFTTCILTKRCLKINMVFVNGITERQLHKDENRQYRWTAYKAFTVMIYGFLGGKNRVPIPSCVINKIRKTFPDVDATYTGFQWFSDYNVNSAPFAQNF